jgi:hypothetical protein
MSVADANITNLQRLLGVGSALNGASILETYSHDKFASDRVLLLPLRGCETPIRGEVALTLRLAFPSPPWEEVPVFPVLAYPRPEASCFKYGTVKRLIADLRVVLAVGEIVEP